MPLGNLRPEVMASIFWGSQMSSLHDRFAAVTDTRLSIVTKVAAHLNAELCKLNELREQVRKLSARQTGHQKERVLGIKEAGPARTFSGV